MRSGRRPWYPAEVIGLGWALGVALFGETSFALWALGVPWLAAIWPALALALVTLLAGQLWLARMRSSPTRAEPGAPAGLWALALVVAAAQVIRSAWNAVHTPLASWDAWSIWAFKARMFAGGGPPTSYFHGPVTLYTHPDYPLNVPLAEAALLRLPGPLGPGLSYLLGPACLAGLLLLFYAGLSRLHGARAAAMVTGALALIPALPMQAAGGDADVPLAMYGGGAALYLLLWWRLRCPADAVLCALLAGGAAWTKKEGLAIAALVLLASAAGEAVRRRDGIWVRTRHVAIMTLAAALFTLPWLLFTWSEHPSGRDFLPMTAVTLVTHIGRAPHIVLSVALQMLDFANWSLLWPAVAALSILCLVRRSPGAFGLMLLLLLQIGVYGLAFAFSSWQPYTAHVQTSLDRLLVQATPLALLVVVECASAMTAARATEVTARSSPGNRLAA